MTAPVTLPREPAEQIMVRPKFHRLDEGAQEILRQVLAAAQGSATEEAVAWLRDAHEGQGDECLVIAAKGDPGAFPVVSASLIAGFKLVACQYQVQAERAVREIERLEDRIDGLESDLFSAVETAYRRGAHEWARLNYPKWIERIEANAALLKSQDQNNV